TRDLNLTSLVAAYLDAFACRDLADLEGLAARSLQQRQRCGNVARGHDGDHPDAQVEGPLHLGLVDGALGSDQVEDRRPGPGTGIDRCPDAGGQDPAEVFGDATAGDVG